MNVMQKASYLDGYFLGLQKSAADQAPEFDPPPLTGEELKKRRAQEEIENEILRNAETEKEIMEDNLKRSATKEAPGKLLGRVAEGVNTLGTGAKKAFAGAPAVAAKLKAQHDAHKEPQQSAPAPKKGLGEQALDFAKENPMGTGAGIGGALGAGAGALAGKGARQKLIYALLGGALGAGAGALGGKLYSDRAQA